MDLGDMARTEAMLALLTAVTDIERLLVVVPNSALRDQIAGKFLTLGVLKIAGALDHSVDLPVVATLEGRWQGAYTEGSELHQTVGIAAFPMPYWGE